jgi:hypothetical protein
MSIVLQSSGGGSVTINEPSTASNFTQTLPAATGDVMVSGNMPAFSAYGDTAQTISSATFTKVTFGTEDFDTNSNFASSTFTPTVAGYYQLNLTGVLLGATSITRGIVALYKNGSAVSRISDLSVTTSSVLTLSGSMIVYANGSTDYFEMYVYATGAGTLQTSQTGASTSTSRFSGSLLRAA